MKRATSKGVAALGGARTARGRAAMSAAALLLCALPACDKLSGSGGIAMFDRALALGGRQVSPETLNIGVTAYTHYCRPCHGASGDGGGPSGRGLRPPPRDLRLGVYKFTSVPAGQLPTDDDLRRIIRHGLHGTAMLPWDLAPAELEGVIQYIKTFAARWTTETPGEPIAAPPDPWRERPAAGVERGRAVYHGLAQCAVACHPAYATRDDIARYTRELTGQTPTDLRADLYLPVPKPSDYGTVLVPPDFTFHPLRSGERPDDIFRVIAAGVGGTAMPTWKNVLPDDDLWAMAHYVRSLVALRGTRAAGELRAKLTEHAR